MPQDHERRNMTLARDAAVSRRADQNTEALTDALRSSPVLADFKREWELGLWDQLATIDYRSYASSDDAALVALMVATANQALGNHEAVAQCVEFSLQHGCPTHLAIQVLASGVHNVLGRARLAAGSDDAAIRQFRASVEIGMRSGRVSLVAAARSQQQRYQMGINDDADTPDLSCRKKSQIGKASNHKPAQAIYRDAPRKLVQEGAAPFILLDSKSLPRAGLHYLRNRLEAELGSGFSFCEWYQEPGCCRCHPCALTGFMDYRRDQRRPAIRLIKSHDFELSDPIIEPHYSLRRLILKRDPLYVLTSWFALDQLHVCRSHLSAQGIKVEKLYLKHEPELLSAAYAILEKVFDPPASDELQHWLNLKVSYIIRFHAKWMTGRSHAPDEFIHVIDYDEIDGFVTNLLEEMCGSEDHLAERVSRENPKEDVPFMPRRDPFESRVGPISSYLIENKTAFYDAVARVDEELHC